MCREAMKHYLMQTENDENAVARFVEESDPGKLRDPETVLMALRSVKVCDPACGSGAYLRSGLRSSFRPPFGDTCPVKGRVSLDRRSFLAANVCSVAETMIAASSA